MADSSKKNGHNILNQSTIVSIAILTLDGLPIIILHYNKN